MFRRKKRKEVDPLTESEALEMTRLKKEAFNKTRQAKADFDAAFQELQGFIDLSSFLKKEIKK